MIDYREHLAEQVRAALGEHNDPAKPLATLVSEASSELTEIRQLLEQRRARIENLEQCLREARANMEDWGCYVDEYFREKHGLAEDLAAIDAVLGGGSE